METQQNLEAEQAWYDSDPWVNRDCFLMKWPFVHPRRHRYAYDYARRTTRQYIQNYLISENVRIHRALVAPCGSKADQDILAGMAEEFHGVDVSSTALDRVPEFVITKQADILETGYEDNSFDFVASFLFFHHVHRVGFDPFLEELHRIIRNGGYLFILEPSDLYPLCKVMNLGRRIFGNISGLVPDERPIRPSRMDYSLKNAGFHIVKFASVSFSHVRIPYPLQVGINMASRPLQMLFPFLGWLCLWICTKR
jgi:SAM-dependent methyltransferase